VPVNTSTVSVRLVLLKMNNAATVLVAQPEVNAAATAPFAAVGAMPGAAQYAPYLKSRRTCP
jgi:hypothetical protein